jgi:hypothetical protein
MRSIRMHIRQPNNQTNSRANMRQRHLSKVIVHAERRLLVHIFAETILLLRNKLLVVGRIAKGTQHIQIKRTMANFMIQLDLLIFAGIGDTRG